MISSHPSAQQGSYTPTPLLNITYGAGSINKLPSLADQFLLPLIFPRTNSSQDGGHDGETRKDGKVRVMIVTGKSLAEKTPVISDAQKLMEKEGWVVTVHQGIGEHAPIKGIRDAVEIVKDKKINLLVAIGGGSPIDAAKAISYFAQEDSKSSTFIPIIAVPTTLSAAEHTMNSGYSNENGDKIGVASGEIVPKVIIYDGEITLYTPETLWLSTGLRALDHAIETLYRKGAQTPIKYLALASIRELFICLPQTKANPDDVTVRDRLLVAAWESLHSNMVPTAIGLSHSLGHKLGASYSISHGQCSVFTLSPSVLLLSRTLPLGSWGLTSLSAALSAIPSSFLPTDLDEGVPSEIGENEERRNAWKVGMAVDTLVKEIGLGGKKLRDYKVGEDNLMGIAEAATKSLKDWEGVPEAKVVVHEVLKKIF